MASTAVVVPRLLRKEITKQWILQHNWSPHALLAAIAAESTEPRAASLFTVKRSTTSRFFMYEEHGGIKLRDKDGPTEVLQLSATQLADSVCETNTQAHHHHHHQKHHHSYYYWTSPIRDVAPRLLTGRLEGYETLYQDRNSTTTTTTTTTKRCLDPRGPSLWIGSSGSATQAHYDVADNVVVQLFGTKRIRCYPPAAAVALHVFPDAHPRARKSQVNFDSPNLRRYPHFPILCSPVVDVVLAAGDALSIPAFWFHHVENGRVPGFDSATEQHHHGGGYGSSCQDGPSVSLNLFAISRQMLIAQQIFVDASRSVSHFKSASDDRSYEHSVLTLRALGRALIDGLHGLLDVEGTSDADEFVRGLLLNTRYKPLGWSCTAGTTGTSSSGITADAASRSSGSSTIIPRVPKSDQDNAEACIAKIMPHFASLKGDKQQQQQQQQHDNHHDNDGVILLVACHLLELWAVELVGATKVASAWEAALPLRHPDNHYE